MDKLEKSLVIGIKLDKKILVLGDVNIYLFQDSPFTVYLTSILKSLDMIQLINELTDLTLTSTNLIDIIRCNESDITELKGDFTNNFSDHKLVYCKIVPEQLSVSSYYI